MKKENRFIINDNYQRFDTDWRFEWDAKTPDKGILFNIYGEYYKDETWYLNADENTESKEDVAYSYIDGEEGLTNSEWVPGPNGYSPILEYDKDGISKWDGTHPLNETRYLRPGEAIRKENSIIFGNGIYNVHIDTEPPQFISDEGTTYKTLNKEYRHCEYTFSDKTGVDYKQFTISIGEEIFYDYNRKTENITLKENIKNVKLIGDLRGNYKLSFDLYDVTDDSLNNDHLILKIWDLAGNNSVFEITKTWKNFNKDEINNLQPVLIKYYNTTPSNLQLEVNQIGETWVDVYNPNKDFWDVLEIKFELAQGSLGTIDTSSIDRSEYEKTGHVRFKITNINDPGNVITDAWLYFGDPSIDPQIKSITFAEATLGPWICPDPEGRIYHFEPYTPSMWKNSKTEDFIQFLQYFMNTTYTGLVSKKNISGLEKIARINNYNDIDRLEASLLPRFAEEFGNEIKLNIDELKDLDNAILNETDNFKIKDDDETYDTVKFYLKNLPNYNQLKGSYAGIQMMLRLFGLSCNITNLWLQKSETNEINLSEQNNNFKDEEEMTTFIEHFLTSYFDIKINNIANLEEFNKNVKTLVQLINDIKPINKGLRKIKDVIEEKHNINLFFNTKLLENDNDIMIYKCIYNGSLNKTDIGNNVSFRIPYLMNENEIKKFHNGTEIPFSKKIKNNFFLLQKLVKNKKQINIVLIGSDGKTKKLSTNSYNYKIYNNMVEIIINDMKESSDFKTNFSHNRFMIIIENVKGTDVINTIEEF